MKVSPEFLKKFLNEKNKLYEFISLDDFFVLSHSSQKLKKKFIIMTFDDGYRDNYEYALPIFDEMHIPFTVYITNSFPDKTAFLWWYVLEDILQQNEQIILANRERFDCRTKEEKEKIFLYLRQLVLGLNQESLIEEFKNLFYNYKIDYALYTDNLCLSWDMIKEMSISDYCTIAAHTMNHKALNKLTEDQLCHEIIHGKKCLEENIGKTINHFAYPFGTFNEVGNREIKFMQNCGFNTVCYSFGGNITMKNINRPLELPRKFFGELFR
ncbi:hypothetical protein AGMMS49546_27110 [Spirochaetia bacterium]|nr:hypothetical protein AGMMS49546_27110 [Spirochaetia bacterium]